jgi:Flp pilus assembly protein TadG
VSTPLRFVPRSTRALAGDGAAPVVTSSGQTLVEFALVIPIFMLLVLGTIEFALGFNAVLSVNYATREATQVASTGGSMLGMDCVILRTIEEGIEAPADRSRTQQVEIYRSDRHGAVVGGAITTYVRTGTSNLTCPEGVVALPYTRTANLYPELTRCNVLAGCGGSGTIDHLGVRVTYGHRLVTPVGAFLPAVGGTMTVQRTHAMRLEPVL